MSLNLHTLDPVELLPLPEVPDSYGARNDEDKRVLMLVNEGLASGSAIPVDDAFLRVFAPVSLRKLALLRVVIRPRASQDIEEAIDYYCQVASLEVADRFISEFQTARDLLAERPGIGSRRFAHLLPGLRSWSFDRFPFRLFYVVKNDTLEILAVDHEKRNVTAKSVL